MIGLWRADLARQAVAEQARRLKALPKEAVAVLETAGGVPEPVEPRQATTDALKLDDVIPYLRALPGAKVL